MSGALAVLAAIVVAQAGLLAWAAARRWWLAVAAGAAFLAVDLWSLARLLLRIGR